MRSEVAEAVKATPAVGYLAGALAGIDWGTMASLMACLYTAWLLGEKIWKAVGPRIVAWLSKRKRQ